jgi:hypothetical protein
MHPLSTLWYPSLGINTFYPLPPCVSTQWLVDWWGRFTRTRRQKNSNKLLASWSLLGSGSGYKAGARAGFTHPVDACVHTTPPWKLSEAQKEESSASRPRGLVGELDRVALRVVVASSCSEEALAGAESFATPQSHNSPWTETYTYQSTIRIPPLGSFSSKLWLGESCLEGVNRQAKKFNKN